MDLVDLARPGVRGGVVRILHVTDHYPPVLGGIEAHVAGLARRQADRGDDVVVLTSTPARSDGQHCDDQGAVRVVRVGSPAAGLRFDLSSFDVVHAHVSVVAPFTAPVAAAAARRGVPTIVTVHSMWGGLGPLPGLAAGAWGLRGAPVLWTAVSRAAAGQLVRQLPAGTSVQVLHNAAAVGAREVTPVDPDGVVHVVSTMRVARRKRPVPLVHLFDTVRRNVDVPMTLTIVGDGPLRARTEAAAARRGLASSVTVTGRLPADEVAPVLARSDVYVAPAVLESFGLAVLEARCVGLPVVGRADSGIPEFVRHGQEGLLGATDEELVGHLQHLVESAESRHRISEHNRTVPTTMTWETALVRHEAAYTAAVARSAAPRRVGLRTLRSRSGS